MADRALARAASRLLVEHWEAGTRLPALPPDLRPMTRVEGYAIQSELMAYTGAPLFRWKIAATSAAGQRHIRVDGPLAGRLLAEKVIADGATVSVATSLMRCVEVEFAFRMGRTLPPFIERHGERPIDGLTDAFRVVRVHQQRGSTFVCRSSKT